MGFQANRRCVRCNSRGITIRAPALPSVLANDTNSRTDGKAGARMKGMVRTEDDLTRLIPKLLLLPGKLAGARKNYRILLLQYRSGVAEQIAALLADVEHRCVLAQTLAELQ